MSRDPNFIIRLKNGESYYLESKEDFDRIKTYLLLEGEKGFIDIGQAVISASSISDMGEE